MQVLREPAYAYRELAVLCMAVVAAVAVLALLASVWYFWGYSFGDWARDQGYEPGDVMPDRVQADEARIDSLDGIGDFDWTTTPTTELDLRSNQLSRIRQATFLGRIAKLGKPHGRPPSPVKAGPRFGPCR